jgi:hypothetical protein
MVAYSFAPRFASLVESGQKTQTIRAHRKRHARPGEPVQLFTGMRTRACRRLLSPDPVCDVVFSIEMLFEVGCPGGLIRPAGATDWAPISDDFARSDGFADAGDMRGFWVNTWGIGRFEGVLIGWERA